MLFIVVGTIHSDGCSQLAPGHFGRAKVPAVPNVIRRWEADDAPNVTALDRV
jgi:hypothetical protein